MHRLIQNTKVTTTDSPHKRRPELMEVAQHFERFLDNISLDVPKLNRIRSEHGKATRSAGS